MPSENKQQNSRGTENEFQRQQEFEACVAEYVAAHDELRDRTNGVRRVTEYALLALGATTTLISISFGATPGQTLTIPNVFPSYYLLLVIPILFIFLASIYVDESLAVYIAQTYIIYELRPAIKRIIANDIADDSEGKVIRRLIHDHIWEWDMFHIFARGAPSGSLTAFTRTLISFLLPIGLPSALYVIASIRDKGYLATWEVGVIAVFAVMLVWHLYSIARMRADVYIRLQKYRSSDKYTTNPIRLAHQQMEE